MKKKPHDPNYDTTHELDMDLGGSRQRLLDEYERPQKRSCSGGRLVAVMQTGTARNEVTGQTAVVIQFTTDDGAVTEFVVTVDLAETLQRDVRKMIKLAREAQQ